MPAVQLWTRYLEGDKIPTKIGLGGDEIEFGPHFFLDRWDNLRSG